MVAATARPVPWSRATAVTVRIAIQPHPRASSACDALTLAFYLKPEMNNMQQVPDKNALLTRINELKQGIEDVKRKRTTQLRAAQTALLESNTSKEDQVTRQNVDYIEDEINTALRYLRDQLKRIADTPGCGTPGPAEHYTIAKKSLQDEITAYQGDQSNFHKRLEEQVRRRYQIANPEATPDELEAGVQAVMQGQEQAFMVGSC